MWEWLAQIVELWKDAYWHLIWAAVYTVLQNYEAADGEWQYFRGKIQTIFEMVWNVGQTAYNAAVDWANPFITSLLNSVRNLWDSITSVWAQFGAPFLSGDWTVVTWVLDKVTGVVNWAQFNYDQAKSDAINAWTWVRTTGANVRDWVIVKGANVWAWVSEKGDTVWAWIDERGAFVWDWVQNYVSPITDWVTKYIAFYIALYESYRDMLLELLEDPETFIADRVADRIEYVLSEAIRRYW